MVNATHTHTLHTPIMLKWETHLVHIFSALIRDTMMVRNLNQQARPSLCGICEQN